MSENFLEIIKKIQEARSPKYFLWQIIKDLEWFASEKYKGWLIGKKDNIIYFNYDSKNHSLYYNYHKLYCVLETKYQLNEQKINELINDMVSEHIKLRVDTTFYWEWNDDN